MEFIEVEYNRNLGPIEKLLLGVKRPGDFFVSGTMELPMPKVDVDGVGTLSFPVPEEQIKAIVRRAERAPYGRGEKTIVDMSIRKVWQIAPGKIGISGKSWTANFDRILSKVSAGLGCEGVAVSAELYKLLIYDRDGFFLPHRDTEKSEGMFGTLVLTLPSAHRGGELLIRHAGREVTVDTSTTEFSEVSYVAFYADCEHEARPVREGNRLCLVYNLIQKRGKGRSKVLRAPEYESQIAEAAAILERFLRAQDAPAKIAWLLEHQYSPEGLSFSALKAADAAKASVLVQAASRAECAAHLGIVHIGDSGAAEPDYDEDYETRWNRYRDEAGDDEDNEEFENDEGEVQKGGDGERFTVVSVDDSWQYVDEWRDISDRPVELGPIPLADGELLPVDALDGEKPDKQRLTEASGNEGASYERSYHRAALVLWQRARYADVLLQAGVIAALPYLNELIGAGTGSRHQAGALARRMVDAWAGESGSWHSHRIRAPESAHRAEMVALLVKLSAAGLLERFISETVTPCYDGSENAALVSTTSALGAQSAAVVLSALISERMSKRACECTELLLALAENPSNRFPEVASAAVAGLDQIGKPADKPGDFDWEPEEGRRLLSPQLLVNLFHALARFKAGTLREAAAQKLAARPETFDPVTIVVPALEQMQTKSGRKTVQSDSAFLHLWTCSAEFLLQRSEVPPEPPSDWRLDVKLSCPCPDCRELQTFALDPAARVHRFRVKKERRRHLHQAIDRARMDMAHVTERRGSPQTLVCTKDRRSYDRRRKQYEREIAAMRKLVGLAPRYSSTTALSARMLAAVARSPD